MKYCDKCNVEVAGEREKCPLCQSVLNGEPTEETFPYVAEKYKKLNLFFKILILVLVVAAVASVVVNLALPAHGYWCVFVVAGIICGSLSLLTAIKKRRNILKNLMYQTVLLSIFSVLWDYFIGWHKWSINFVIPSIFILAMISMYILSKVLKISAEEYLVYLVVLVIFGIVPVIFLANNMLWVRLPSIISVGFSTISFFVLLLFEGEKMWQEFNKRLHI